MSRLRFSLIALLASAALLAGCGTSNANDGGVTYNHPDGSSCILDGGIGVLPDGAVVYPDGGLVPDGGLPDGAVIPPPLPTTTVACPYNGMIYACGDLLDSEEIQGGVTTGVNDGLIDSQDPDCLGPCDNNEVGFTPNIAGNDNVGTCDRDCYFDDNAGSGNDGCARTQACDATLTAAANAVDSSSCDFNAMAAGGNKCPDEQSGTGLDPSDPMYADTCLDNCLPLLPNGCDCFGCCDISGEGDYIFLGSGAREGHPTCNRGTMNDPTKCYPCTPDLTCVNTCGECELCLDRTVDDLPAHCFQTDPDGGPPPERCEGGEQPCGLPGDDACPTGLFCTTGCCIGFVPE